MTNQKKLILLIISLFVINHTAFTQTIFQINSRIDSLENLKNELEQKLKIIIEEIEDLKNRKELIELNSFDKVKQVQTKTKKKTYLMSEPSSRSTEIISIPENTPIEIIDYDNSFYKAIYKNKIGFIWGFYVEKDSILESYKKYRDNEKKKKRTEEIEEKTRKEEELKKIEQEKQKKILAKRKQMLIDKYGRTIANKILEGKIWLGMTKEMAIESLGRPNDINRTVNAYKINEQWVYDKIYLYFENDILISWQD